LIFVDWFDRAKRDLRQLIVNSVFPCRDRQKFSEKVRWLAIRPETGQSLKSLSYEAFEPFLAPKAV